jgi:hypothetical protein
MKRFLPVTLLLAFFTSHYSIADEKPAVLDFVNQQLATQKLNALKATSTPELIQAQAQYYRKMYQALIKTGFDQQQAMQIVVAMASSDK